MTLTKSEVVKGLETIQNILNIGNLDILSTAITYLQQEPIGREELRELKKYCSCKKPGKLCECSEDASIHCNKCGLPIKDVTLFDVKFGFDWMKTWLIAYDKNNKTSLADNIMDWINQQPMGC